jgi:predicted RecB family nuclease
MTEGLFVACDVLTRGPDGWRLIEVKSSSRQKDEHLTDVAVQAHVLARCGIEPQSAGVMHLNGEFRHPDVGDLFAVTEVTDGVRDQVPPTGCWP